MEVHCDGDAEEMAVVMALVCAGITVMGLLVMIPWESLRVSLRKRAERGGLTLQCLSALPISVFAGGDKVAEECECAICLSELTAGQLTRVLPRCGHLFHRDCIDKWLVACSSCPTCRASVVSSFERISSWMSFPFAFPLRQMR